MLRRKGRHGYNDLLAEYTRIDVRLANTPGYKRPNLLLPERRAKPGSQIQRIDHALIRKKAYKIAREDGLYWPLDVADLAYQVIAISAIEENVSFPEEECYCLLFRKSDSRKVSVKDLPVHDVLHANDRNRTLLRIRTV